MTGNIRKQQKEGFLIWSLLMAFSLFFFLFLFLRKKPLEQKTTKIVQNLGLNSRQQKIFEILSSKGEVTVEELMRDIVGISERTLRRDMLKLEKLGFSKKQGNTKGSKYIYTR